MPDDNYIKSIHLQNFRSWKEGFVEFVQGVNIIIGENDSGKTNILRGINFDVNNRPAGEDMRSNWGGTTEVQIDIGGQKVSRIRSDNENLYRITGHQEPFKAFGASVPEVIKQHLNFSPINIAFQLDGPFLLGKSPSDVAKYFNEAVNLDIIDRAISNISSSLKAERRGLEKEEKTLEEKISNLKEFEWLDQAEISLVELEKGRVWIVKKEKEFSELSPMIQILKELDVLLFEIEKITRHEKQVQTLAKKQENINLNQSKVRELSQYIITLKELNKQEEQVKKITNLQGETENLIILNAKRIEKNIEYIDLENFSETLHACLEREIQAQKITKQAPQLEFLIELDQKIEAKTNDYNTFFDLKNALASLEIAFARATEKRQNLESEFDELMPNVCPLCMQKIKKCNHRIEKGD